MVSFSHTILRDHWLVIIFIAIMLRALAVNNPRFRYIRELSHLPGM